MSTDDLSKPKERILGGETRCGATHLDDVPDQVRQDLVLLDLLRILGDLFLHLVLFV